MTIRIGHTEEDIRKQIDVKTMPSHQNDKILCFWLVEQPASRSGMKEYGTFCSSGSIVFSAYVYIIVIYSGCEFIYN